jgi:quercetin dioxygenase-like cupin family protein
MPEESPSRQRFSTPQAINDVINYQDDAVVSRQLVHQPAGSITLFAFDAQQSLSEHTAPYDALVLVTDGRAEIRVAGVTHEVKAGEMLLLPAGSPHALLALEPFKMVLTMIKS